MTEVRVGDEVEVTFRGILGRLASDDEYGYLRLAAGTTLSFSKGEAEMRVIKKAPPKVGDRLTTVEDLRKLPAKSVVRFGHFNALRTTRGTFVDEMSLHHDAANFTHNGVNLSQDVELVALPPGT